MRSVHGARGAVFRDIGNTSVWRLDIPISVDETIVFYKLNCVFVMSATQQCNFFICKICGVGVERLSTRGGTSQNLGGTTAFGEYRLWGRSTVSIFVLLSTN